MAAEQFKIKSLFEELWHKMIWIKSGRDCSALEWAEAMTVTELREKGKRGYEHKLRQKSAGQAS